ncbi:MAG: hypothetical protein S4CHLAM7_04490 [Chlamydiae bacterium]|nr:hypothetical protein [Chlamydiota bacterium]
MSNLYKAQLFTLIFSWFFAVLFIYLGGSLYSPLFLYFLFLYMWIPGLVALYFYKLEKMRIPLKIKWHSSIIPAVLTPLALVALTDLFSLPFLELRSTGFLKEMLPSFLYHCTPFTRLFVSIFLGAIVAVIAGCTFYLLPTLGQELMWRGYLWDKIKFSGFWKASFVTGALWGVWQAPLVFLGYSYPCHPFIGILWIILYSILISPLLLYFRLKSHTVLGSSIFDGVLKAFSSTLAIFFISPNYLLVGVQGITGFCTCILFNLLLFIKIRKNLLLEYEI